MTTETKEEIAEFLRGGHTPAEEAAFMLEASPAVAEVESEIAAIEPTRIRVSMTRGRRTTGFLVSCSEHGRLPIEIRKKQRALEVAGRHRSGEHHGYAELEVFV